MRARWSDRQNCSHNVSQKVERIRRFSEANKKLQFSVKNWAFCEKRGGNSVNDGLGKDFYRKGNSMKRSGPFSEPPDPEN